MSAGRPRPFFVPRLLVITDRHATSGRDLVSVIADALGAAPPGLVAVQLREKDLPVRDLLALARRLRALTDAAGAALYVNDRADVASAVDADGVHLGVASLPIAAARRAAPGLRVAVSTHGVADVQRARDEGADFAVFGPVFATPSKLRYGPPLGADALAQAVPVGLPLLGLGGVNVQTMRACAGAGAYGVACIRSVISAESPRAAVTELLAALTSPTMGGAAGP